MPRTKSGKTTTKTTKNAAAKPHRTRKTHRTRPTGHTVRAASANTSERISGTAQDTARASQNAAAEGTQRMTDQVTQLFGLSGERGEELTRRSAQSIEAVTQASTAMTRGLQDLSREFITLAQEGIQRNVDALGAISRCRSFQEFVALQSELMRDNLQHTLESTRRVAEVSTRIASEATQTIARQAGDKGQRRAA